MTSSPAPPDLGADVADDSEPGRLRSTASVLVANPLRTVAILLTLLAIGVRLSVVRDAFFITDDYMLSARAMENTLSWGYATRVHTGHFEPIGFVTMWLLAHYAPLNWPVTVVVLVAGQLLLFVVVWQLLKELFGRRPLILVPYALVLFTPLTMPAFTWLSAAIIWLPLMIGLAGAMRWHVRYVRTGRWQDALRAAAWFVVMLASFEKSLIYLPYAIALTFAVRPDVAMRLSDLRRLFVSRWHVWLGYLVPLVGYLLLYIPGVRSIGNDSPITQPSLGPLSDFVFLSVFRTLIPGAMGGPWTWQPTSYGLAIVDSPRAFDWFCWILALVVVGISLALRTSAARFIAAFTVYLAGSVAAIAAGRVAFGGSIVALETRYLADATIPLIVTLGAMVMPLVGERNPWTPFADQVREHLPSARRAGIVVVGVSAMILTSLHSMDGYAGFSSRNPYRAFVDNTRTTLAALPEDAQIFDTLVPGEIIGPLFADYNRASRYLSPLVDDRLRKDLYTRLTYTNPYVLNGFGQLVPMRVSPATSSVPRPDSCYVVDKGRVTVPLSGEVFEWGWVARIGYLADRPVSGTVRLGSASVVTAFPQGLGQIFINLKGSGSQIVIDGLPEGANFCVGDVLLGTPEPAPTP